MSDNRFFEKSGPYKLKELSDIIKGKISSSNFMDILIDDISSLISANSKNITFFSNLSLTEELKNSSAGACIIKKEHKHLAPEEMPLLFVEDPYLGFALVSQKFYPKELSQDYLSGVKNNQKSGVSKTAVTGNAVIEKGAVIGDNVNIGNNTFIGPNSVVAANVQIGENCYIGANVSITHSIISSNVLIHNGTCIGQDGFGFAMTSYGHEKIPQIGLVKIDDNVEIGSNCTIDRGTSENTIIGTGTKIDNMVHIAHNCIIGRNCILTGMVGLAGSTVLEDFVVMGAKSGAAGHLTIGQGSQIAAKAGITKDLAPGKKWAGYPAKEMDEWKKDLINIRKLSKKD